MAAQASRGLMTSASVPCEDFGFEMDAMGGTDDRGFGNHRQAGVACVSRGNSGLDIGENRAGQIEIQMAA